MTSLVQSTVSASVAAYNAGTLSSADLQSQNTPSNLAVRTHFLSAARKP